MDYRMVPQLSALSLALCHEVLEGGGNQQIRKKKLPLLLTPFAIHCLTKATAFVPQCEIMEPSKWSYNLEPVVNCLPLFLAKARNSLPHSLALVPQCDNRAKIWSQNLEPKSGASSKQPPPLSR